MKNNYLILRLFKNYKVNKNISINLDKNYIKKLP